MRKKIKGYALINSEGDYLEFEQVDSNDIEVYATDNIDEAMIFDTYTDASETGYDVRYGTGEWNYCAFTIPTDIVKVKKYIEVDKVGKVVGKRQK